MTNGTPLPWATDESKLIRDENTGQMVLDLNDDNTREQWLVCNPKNA